MFDDPTLVGPWSTLVTRLRDEDVLARWSADVPELSAVGDVGQLLDAWADPARTHQVAAGLIRLAAADGGRDDDALLLLLHLLSGGDMKFQDFNESVKNLMPSLGSLGISLQSGGAALAYLTDRGMKADVASTRLTMGLALMSAPTKQAAKYLSALGPSNQDVTAKSAETANALKKAGLTTTQLSADLRKPDGIQVALMDLKTHLEASGVSADAADAIMSKIFGGGRTDKGIMSLMQNLDGLKDKYGLIGKAAGNFGEAWKATQNTFKFQMDQMKARAENFLIALGTKLLPIASAALKDLGKAFDWLGNHQGVLQALGAALAGVVATGLGIAAVAAWTLLAPFLAIAVPIAAVSVALFELYQHSATFRDLVKAAMNVMKEGVIAAFHEVQRIIKSASAWWKEHGAQVKFVAENLLRKAFTYISEGVKWTADRVKEALKFAEQWWHQHGAQVKELIETVLVKSFHAIVTAVEWAVDQVKKALKFAEQWWHDHGRQVKEAVGLIWNVVKVGIGLIVAFFEWAWPYIKIIVDTAWKLIKDIVGGAIKIVSDVIGTFIDLLTGNWGKLWDDVKKLVGDAFEAVKGIFRDFGTGALRLLYQAGKDVIQGLINGIKDMGGAIGGAIGDVASGAVNMAKHVLGIGSPSKVFHELGMNLGQGLANGIDASAGLAMSASARLASAAIPAVAFNPFTGGASGASGGSISGGSGGSFAAAGASSPGTSGVGGITVTVNVGGSVVTEQALVDTILTALQRREQRGHVLGLGVTAA